jgi:FixJ family two-component response regulator
MVSKLRSHPITKRDHMSVDKQHVYVVDDDLSICRALKILLMSFGYVVKTFVSADRFFESVLTQATGCLVLDVHMPGLDGWETQKRLVSSGSKLSIIFISADKNGGQNERALKAGAIGFLSKPFSAQELVDLIQLAFVSVP